MAVKRGPSKPAPKKTTAKKAPKKSTAKKAAAKKSPPKKGPSKPPTRKSTAKKTATAKKGSPLKRQQARNAKKASVKGPAKKPSAVGGDYITKKEFGAAIEDIAKQFAEQKDRIDEIELRSFGYHGYISRDEEGRVVLNIEEAPHEFLREWCYQFGFDYDGDEDDLRERLIKARSKKGFKGFEVVRTLPIPDDEEQDPAEEEEEESEDDGDEISVDDIMGMNWTQLTEIADQCEIDYEDLSDPEQPKVLRNRVLNHLGGEEAVALAEEQDPAEEEEESEDDGDELSWEDLDEDTPITVDVEGEAYEALFRGVDEDGGILFVWAAEPDEEPQVVDAELVSLS